ncbi:hypothetical protein AAFF_G00282590 [Aldrovandia affinis]|uniref:Uncharacterized protein n=1 Tax=Aldrovandia affinis TaxID=143900 RepID=A0AAD7T9U8_9TELE|nr:hypothetical protein AAFF_G00282590 [Aldrovandia affinis]
MADGHSDRPSSIIAPDQSRAVDPRGRHGFPVAAWGGGLKEPAVSVPIAVSRATPKMSPSGWFGLREPSRLSASASEPQANPRLLAVMSLHLSVLPAGLISAVTSSRLSACLLMSQRVAVREL